MGYAVLLMIGGTLLINGLAVLGYVQGNGAAIYNIFTGVLGTVTPFYLLTQVSGSDAAAFDTVLAVAPMWLFALTFLWVGINSLTGHTPTGVGWYCLWVVFAAVGFGLVNFLRFDAPREGIIWLNWAFLWGLFWLLLAQGRTRLATFTGWVAVIQSIWTVSAQAFMNMVGGWTTIPVWAFIVATAVTIVLALLLAGRAGVSEDAASDEVVQAGTHRMSAASA
ncbi:AmiS/UreI family transporter [Pseudonocardia hispaniensis]|uniref:AmiS/UreI family transporter n=1 Tax=Pseudonocardia hispaniensis TaxID=904933 RepID=A0ABW1J8R0_9PSEU